VRTPRRSSQPGRFLKFHAARLRSNARFIAGIPIRAIAEIMAWDEDSVEKIIRRYVQRAALTQAPIVQLNEAGSKTGKPAGKPDDGI
jgi:hypothetical protein